MKSQKINFGSFSLTAKNKLSNHITMELSPSYSSLKLNACPHDKF